MYFVELGMTKKLTTPAGANAFFPVKTRKDAVKIARALIWGSFEDIRSSKMEKTNDAEARILRGGSSNGRVVIWNDDETRWIAITKQSENHNGSFAGSREAMHGPE